MVELLVCCLGWACGVWIEAATTAPFPRLESNGREWHDLAAWGQAHRLSFAWNRATRAVELTNATTRLSFTVNSPQSVINGVKVWLSLPITPSGNHLLVSVLDVEGVLKPLLWPTRPSPPQRIRTIMLDPGHGGKDPGNQAGTFLEKRYTLLLAQQVRARLEAAGYHVLLTRNRDTFVELTDRIALANRAKADLFLSLHFNAVAARSASAEGIETFCLTPHTASSTHAPRTTTQAKSLPGHRSADQNILLAYQLQKALVRRTKLTDRGVKHARFVVLRDATMPAVLIEAGFMSSKSDRQQILDPSARARMADAIVEAIRVYRQQTGG